jgi:hypothetical protein
MKPYLITTGLLFAIMALLHVWRAIAEWPESGLNASFLTEMSLLVLVPAVLAWWAWRVLCESSRPASHQSDKG